MNGQITVRFTHSTRRLARAVEKLNATLVRGRVARLRSHGHDRKADALEVAYYFTHGLTPAEHAYRLMVEQRLDSDRWSPQP